MEIKQVLIIILLIIFSISFVKAQTNLIMISKEVIFRLTSFNTLINFLDDITADRLESFMDKVKFYNVQMDSGPTVPEISFSVKDANMTITNLFTNNLINLSLSLNPGTKSEIKINYTNAPKNVTCPSCSDLEWSFDDESGMLSINATL